MDRQVLPQEIWSSVLTYLPPEDFIALCCTCKQLYLERHRVTFSLFSCVRWNPRLFVSMMFKAEKKGVIEKVPDLDLLKWYLEKLYPEKTLGNGNKVAKAN